MFKINLFGEYNGLISKFNFEQDRSFQKVQKYNFLSWKNSIFYCKQINEIKIVLLYEQLNKKEYFKINIFKSEAFILAHVIV